jgi:hypothetical protein
MIRTDTPSIREPKAKAVAIAADLVVTALVVLADVPDLAAVPPSETVLRVPAALVALVDLVDKAALAVPVAPGPVVAPAVLAALVAPV